MAARRRISCINKNDRDNPYERIENVGGVDGTRWKISQPDAIRNIENQIWDYYVLDKNGNEVDVIVAKSRFGNKYLKTRADGEQPDNLLRLPTCP